MAKHTQTIRWLLPNNCLSVFDHVVGLALKGLSIDSFPHNYYSWHARPPPPSSLKAIKSFRGRSEIFILGGGGYIGEEGG